MELNGAKPVVISKPYRNIDLVGALATIFEDWIWSNIRGNLFDVGRDFLTKQLDERHGIFHARRTNKTIDSHISERLEFRHGLIRRAGDGNAVDDAIGGDGCATGLSQGG